MVSESDTDADSSSDGSIGSDDGRDRRPENTMWMQALERELQNRPTRRGPNRRPLSAADWATLCQAYEQRMRDSRSPLTWNNIASVVNNFREWDACQTLRQYSHLPLDVRMAMWVEWKILQEEIKKGTPVRYTKRLEQHYYNVTRTRSVQLAEYRRSLKRRGFYEKGAEPCTQDEVQRAIEATNVDKEKAQLLFMWLLPGRTADVLCFRKEDVTQIRPEAETLWLWVRWPEGAPKNAGRIEDTLQIPDQYAQMVKRVLEQTAPGQKIFLAKSTRVTQILTQVNPVLTSHSIKKGALTMLVNRGHSLEDVAFKAHHSSVKLLRVYIGERLWSLAHNVSAMAGTLAAAMIPQPQH